MDATILNGLVFKGWRNYIVEKFEDYLNDFGGLDAICEACEIDPLQVLHLLYEEFMFDPKKLEAAYGGEYGTDDWRTL